MANCEGCLAYLFAQRAIDPLGVAARCQSFASLGGRGSDVDQARANGAINSAKVLLALCQKLCQELRDSGVCNRVNAVIEPTQPALTWPSREHFRY